MGGYDKHPGDWEEYYPALTKKQALAQYSNFGREPIPMLRLECSDCKAHFNIDTVDNLDEEASEERSEFYEQLEKQDAFFCPLCGEPCESVD